MKENKEMNDLLENMNKCIIEIEIRDKIYYQIEKLDFLEKKGFYNRYPDYIFKQKNDI